MGKYTMKAINKGLGLAPIPDNMDKTEYGAMCMLKGYKLAKKKYKKKIKRLEKQLTKEKDKPLGVLDKIKENDLNGLSFRFKPKSYQQED